MKLDIEDVLAGAITSVFGRALIFTGAIWLGCAVGAFALLAGYMVEVESWRTGVDGSWLWANPMLLLNVWALLNIPFLLFFFIRFIRDEGDDFLTFGILVGVESLVVMAGWTDDLIQGWLPLAVAGFTWLTLVIMLGTGIWLIRQHLINTWARRLGMLRAENAQRHAQTEDAERTRLGKETEP